AFCAIHYQVMSRLQGVAEEARHRPFHAQGCPIRHGRSLTYRTERERMWSLDAASAPEERRPTHGSPPGTTRYFASGLRCMRPRWIPWVSCTYPTEPTLGTGRGWCTARPPRPPPLQTPPAPPPHRQATG